MLRTSQHYAPLFPHLLSARLAPRLGLIAFAFGLCCPAGYAADPKESNPLRDLQTLTRTGKGAILLMGGGKIPESVCTRFIELAGGKKANLVIVPTASSYADGVAPPPTFLFWKGRDVASVTMLHTRDRKVADDPSFSKVLQDATGVWLTGGDQSRLTDAYQGTNFLAELKKVLDRGGVIGGTSAGASVMSSIMITGGTTKASTGAGFGFIPGLIVDQHFTNRNRMGRLSGLITEHTDKVGLGLDESTAVLFQGESFSVIGDANAYLCLSPTRSSSSPSSPTVHRLKDGDRKELRWLHQTILTQSDPPKVKPPVSTGSGPLLTPMTDKGLN